MKHPAQLIIDQLPTGDTVVMNPASSCEEIGVVLNKQGEVTALVLSVEKELPVGPVKGMRGDKVIMLHDRTKIYVTNERPETIAEEVVDMVDEVQIEKMVDARLQTPAKKHAAPQTVDPLVFEYLETRMQPLIHPSIPEGGRPR